MTDQAQTAIATLSFEDSLKELEEIVRALESGNISLDASITSYERGAQLKAHCETKLREAKERVEKITISPDGRATATEITIE